MADALRGELSVWPTADTLPEPDPALKNALAVLAEEDRELLTMIAWDGLSPTEAAAVLGIEPGAARVRLHRARRRLERLLGATGDREGSSAITVRPTVAAPAPSTSHPHAADHRDGPSAVATPFDPRTTATHETTAADRPSPPTSHGDSRPAATADRHQHRTPTPTPATAAHP